jgi:hypothetical protein
VWCFLAFFWVFSTLCLVLGTSVAVLNIRITFSGYPKGRNVSIIPFVGGIALAMGAFTCPAVWGVDYFWFAWLIAFLDPGTSFFVLFLIVLPFQLLFRRQPKTKPTDKDPSAFD